MAGPICTTSLFNRLFNFMEDTGIYDPENELHVFSLHYVYLPRINAALKGFVSGWNHNPLSSEGGLSPMQLWISGLMSEPLTCEDDLTEVRLHIIVLYTI